MYEIRCLCGKSYLCWHCPAYCRIIHFFIANLAKSVTDGTLSLPYLIGFVASLTLVLIPLYFASIFLEKAKFDSLARYNTLFDKHFFGKVMPL